MKDKILDIVEEHCVGWKNCKALTEKLFDLYNVSDTLILTPKDAEVFFNEIMNPKDANEALKKAMLKFITR